MFGAIWILGHLFGKNEEKEIKKKMSYGKPSQDDSINQEEDDTFLDDDIPMDIGDEIDSYAGKVQPPSLTTPNLIKMHADNKTNTSLVSQKSEDEIFRNKCIETYGDYAENTYGLIIVKEDGEYRQISPPDKRYEILSSYIYEYKRERHAQVCLIGNGELLKFYIESCKKFKLFPDAKPMESHGLLEKEYNGEQIAMMMAYYDKELKSYRLYTTPAYSHSLKEFCLALGWDLAMYIHKYIKQPMDLGSYYHLRDMVLRKMSKEEYIEYENKARILEDRGKDGWYDGWNNRLGNNYEEAHKEIEKRQVITYEQAMQEIQQIEWHL